MILILLIIYLMPVITAMAVYRMYRRDLSRVQSLYKLKRGAMERLVARHQKAIYAHLIVFIVAFLVLFTITGQFTGSMLVWVILWIIIFTGHVNTFSNFSKSLISALQEAEVDTSRLEDKQSERVETKSDERKERYDNRHE